MKRTYKCSDGNLKDLYFLDIIPYPLLWYEKNLKSEDDNITYDKHDYEVPLQYRDRSRKTKSVRETKIKQNLEDHMRPNMSKEDMKEKKAKKAKKEKWEENKKFFKKKRKLLRNTKGKWF